MSELKTNLLGYPRIGERRELKAAMENYWAGRVGRDELEAAGRALREQNWNRQVAAGIDLIPCNDFSLYDHVLDMSCLLGNVPERFGHPGGEVGADTMFAMARGTDGARACEMTKWFDTNYHYIVPEFEPGATFALSGSKVFDEFDEARALGITPKPTLVGPVTYLALGKSTGPASDPLALLVALLPVYADILSELAARGAGWVQLDEPVFATDLGDDWLRAADNSYRFLAAAAPGVEIIATSYFGALEGNLETFFSLPVAAFHIDATRSAGELDAAIAAVPDGRSLSLGVVDGRNVWRNDYRESLGALKKARAALGDGRLMVGSSCSLLHCPLTLRDEDGIDPEVRGWLAFAEEKLGELTFLRDFLGWKAPVEELEANTRLHDRRRGDRRLRDPKVRARGAAVGPGHLGRASAFPARQAAQRAELDLPPFPTTTIGSFPQTAEVRRARSRWRRGELGDAPYREFLETQVKRCISVQEEAGLDMLVHGEFERTDMVEFFGEKLDGFALTRNGWVQSYGSRCVKPPIVYGDVSRPAPMTVDWATYAQSLTRKPMKGMLTGPVTMLQWSFVRDDQPRAETATQIALAIRDEVADLERAGLRAIQIDEPAFREGLPLRAAARGRYLAWAVDAFRLSSSSVADSTQIHTHMCYSEFNDIIDSIAALDADVVTIETSRSNMELLGAFADFEYPNEIGPGVYDIHSPRVPKLGEMTPLLREACLRIPAGNLWVNPDCGLKTRRWAEVEPALHTLVEAARVMRREHAGRRRHRAGATAIG